jgi:hypothetical protein
VDVSDKGAMVRANAMCCKGWGELWPRPGDGRGWRALAGGVSVLGKPGLVLVQGGGLVGQDVWVWGAWIGGAGHWWVALGRVRTSQGHLLQC